MGSGAEFCVLELFANEIIDEAWSPGSWSERLPAPMLRLAFCEVEVFGVVFGRGSFSLAGGITIESAKNEPALRPYQIAMKCWDKGFYVRYGGDTIQLGLPFIVSEKQIKDVVGAISDSIKELH